MQFKNNLLFARAADRNDPLKNFRKEFLLPKIKKQTLIYLNGNSLGLQPRQTKQFLNQELKDWAQKGVEGHFSAHRPWLHYHKNSKKVLARLTGAKTSEVVAMNQLTINLHLMMVSFYRPSAKRFKIIIEAGAFPSDRYAVESQIRFHGLKPEDALITIGPRAGEHLIRTEDIITLIQQHGDGLALVMLGAVQYYTGQFFNIRAITQAAHGVGAIAGFDLAHAIGNVPLKLHDDQVDFAVWCSYKYLNAGPGGIAGAFVHERHGNNADLPRFQGWWGHLESERFLMKDDFIPMTGADGWQVSNFPVLAGAPQLAALDIFDRAAFTQVRRKSIQLTGYLEFLLKDILNTFPYFEIITPASSSERGCQLSVRFRKNGKTIFKKLHHAGVITDWREPDVIRVAPVPLYNTFEEVFRFCSILKKSCAAVK